MTYQEFDRWLIKQAAERPHLRGDRAAQQAAQQAGQTASTTGAQYGAQAQGIFGPLTGFAQNEMTAPPGYGPDLQNMEAIAGQTGTAAAANAQQNATLQAARSRNAGGLNAAQDAATEIASQGTGQNIQNILAQNANLKQQQQQEGAGTLQGIYGTNVNAQLGAMGQVPGDINSQVNAGKSGWLQNLEGVLGTIGTLGMGGGAMGLKL